MEYPSDKENIILLPVAYADFNLKTDINARHGLPLWASVGPLPRLPLWASVRPLRAGAARAGDGADARLGGGQQRRPTGDGSPN